MCLPYDITILIKLPTSFLSSKKLRPANEGIRHADVSILIFVWRNTRKARGLDWRSLRFDNRLCTVVVLLWTAVGTSPIKSQMNDISGAIISYHYYRDGYYVSRGALAPSCLLPLLSLVAADSPSRSLAPATLSFHLPTPVSGNTLTVACKESGHCAARKQKRRYEPRISIIEYIPISSGKGRWLRRRFDRTFAYTYGRALAWRASERRLEPRHMFHGNAFVCFLGWLSAGKNESVFAFGRSTRSFHANTSIDFSFFQKNLSHLPTTNFKHHPWIIRSFDRDVGHSCDQVRKLFNREIRWISYFLWVA